MVGTSLAVATLTAPTRATIARLNLEMDFRSTGLMEPISVGGLFGWIALHGLALAAAWGTRVAARPVIELAVQVSFLAAMAAVTAAAWICHQCELGLWMPSAVVLVVMVLVAVTDVRERCESMPMSDASAGR